MILQYHRLEIKKKTKLTKGNNFLPLKWDTNFHTVKVKLKKYILGYTQLKSLLTVEGCIHFR